MAASGTSRLAQALSRDHDLLHWQREGEALVFLEALLRQKPLRKIPRIPHQPGYRLSCGDGWGAAERARFREEAPAPDREDSKAGKTKYSALWQADCNKIARMAPAEYMGRYMPEWWDYAIADEIHQLAGDTAQGNALGVLNKTARRFLGLTGTLLSGYADDLFNTLFRTDAKRMIEDGYEWGSAGRERFTRDFGVIETIERITVEDNACSRKTKKTVTI